MKLCGACNAEKPFDHFGNNKTKHDGLQSSCKECSCLKSRKYYKENKEKHKKSISERKKKNIEFVRQQLIQFLNGKSCVDCGYDNILALEFDHFRDKKNCISQMVGLSCSWETIKKEIDKCEIRCRNCHGIKTHQESKTYKWKYIESLKKE